VSDDPVPRALRITEAPGLDQEFEPGFCRAATFRKAEPQDMFGAIGTTYVVAEDDWIVVGNEGKAPSRRVSWSEALQQLRNLHRQKEN
jgi:hypothetical protein